MNTTTHVVSFSGGRTSAYLVYLMEQRRASGWDVRYIFTDTGAEHPKTYEFIRNLVTNWGIDLTCLRLVINPKLGEGNSYKVVSVDDIGQDLEPFRAALSKYGTPYVGGRFCTRTMKIEPFDRYCKDNFPESVKWLGIRTDEPKRLTPKKGVYYLADISDFDKPDVLTWWKKQPFDLDLPEHLGNCVFCIEKGINKIALAARDEPQMAADFWQLVNEPSVRVVERRQQENKIMYRGNNSLESIIALFSEHSREDIAATIRGGGGYDSGSCTESCDPFDDEPIADVIEAPAVSVYCSKLTELREKPSHLLKEVGDQWCTPDPLFWGINAMFGPLVLDLFSDGENNKCPAFYTAEDNALTQDWSEKLAELHGAAFGNPPYSRAQQHEDQHITGMVHIMAHAMAMRERGGRYVFLIKAATSETWWPEQADHIAFIRGRVGFDLPIWFVPADEKQVPSGAFFAGAVVIFDKTWRGPAMSYISREQLEAQGKAFLAQINAQAARLASQNLQAREVAA
jgi:phage N-6-adenine-methyltransferase